MQDVLHVKRGDPVGQMTDRGHDSVMTCRIEAHDLSAARAPGRLNASNVRRAVLGKRGQHHAAPVIQGGIGRLRPGLVRARHRVRGYKLPYPLAQPVTRGLNDVLFGTTTIRDQCGIGQRRAKFGENRAECPDRRGDQDEVRARGRFP